MAESAHFGGVDLLERGNFAALRTTHIRNEFHRIDALIVVGVHDRGKGSVTRFPDHDPPEYDSLNPATLQGTSRPAGSKAAGPRYRCDTLEDYLILWNTQAGLLMQ